MLSALLLYCADFNKLHSVRTFQCTLTLFVRAYRLMLTLDIFLLNYFCHIFFYECFISRHEEH